jgi:capsid portal protein
MSDYTPEEQSRIDTVYLDPEVVTLPEPLAKETMQPLVENDVFTPENAITPPLSLDGLALLTQTSPIRGACLDALSLNTVGLGYTLAKAEPAEGEAPDPGEEVRVALEAIAARDRRMDRPSFTDLLKAVKRDEEEFGNGYLEVSRDRRSGQIDGIYHMDPRKVRRRGDRKGYILTDGMGMTAVEFSNFGEKVEEDGEGKPTNKLLPGASWGKNECLVFKLYTSESRDYGLPRDSTLALDYLGDKKAAEANVSFFDSSGTPPTVLFVQGVEQKDGARITFKVPAETSRRISETLRSDSGHRHRVAVIPVPPGTSTKEVQLGKISDRDMGFTEFREDNRDRALSAFRLQPIFVGASGDGRYDAEVQRAITLEQVFDPEQRRYETRLANTLLRGLGYPDWRISFKRLAVEADAARREAAERMAESQAITNREFREAHGYPPLAEDGVAVPHGWNDALVTIPKLAPGAPEGAENRVNEADDQRGLRPGVGGRVSRDKLTGQPRHVEGTVTDLTSKLRESGRAQVGRAVTRARGSA